MLSGRSLRSLSSVTVASQAKVVASATIFLGVAILLASFSPAEHQNLSGEGANEMGDAQELSTDENTITLTKDGGCVCDTHFPLTTRFRLTNLSESDWTLRAKKTSCTCTVPSLNFTKIRSGEAVDIDVTISAKLEAPKQLNQTVELQFLDEAGRVRIAKLIIRLQARPSIFADPTELNLTLSYPPDPVRDTSDGIVTIHSYVDMLLSAPDIASKPSPLDIVLESTTRPSENATPSDCLPRQSWRYRIKPSHSAMPRFGKSIHRVTLVSTSLPDHPVSLLVGYDIRGLLKAFPESIKLKVDERSTLTGSAFISVDARMPPDSLDFTSELSGVPGKAFVERRSKELLHLTVTIPSDSAIIATGACVRIWPSHPQHSTPLEIPVYR